MTTPPNIYIEVPITYEELNNALIKLGFQLSVEDKNHRFTNDDFKSMVLLPNRSADAIVERIYVASYSYRLFLQGVIKHEEDLIKLILKTRLKKNQSSSVPKNA